MDFNLPKFSCQTSYSPYLPNLFTAEVFTIQYIVLSLFHPPWYLCGTCWGYHRALLLVADGDYFGKSGLSSTNSRSEMIVMIAMCFCSACHLRLSRLGLKKSCLLWRTPPIWALKVLPLLWNGMMFCKSTEVFQTFFNCTFSFIPAFRALLEVGIKCFASTFVAGW